MFYEDVDLGWRLNLLGYRVRYVPGSVAYHRHHVTMKKFGNFRESYLLERNALLVAVQEPRRRVARPGAARRDGARRAPVGRARRTSTRRRSTCSARPAATTSARVEIPKMALTGPYAIDYFVEQLPSLARVAPASSRPRGGAATATCSRCSARPSSPRTRMPSLPRGARGAASRRSASPSTSPPGTAILVVTGEPLLARMAGPAIRAWEIAERARAASTTSGSSRPRGAKRRRPRLRGRVRARRRACARRPTWADVIIFQGFLLETAPWLKEQRQDRRRRHLRPDAPRAARAGAGPRAGRPRRARCARRPRALNEQLRRADFLLCASEKQRDFWLGQLAGLGRINPAIYDEDATLDTLIAVVPFGIARRAARADAARRSRARSPGIGPDDKVILWGGGDLQLVRPADADPRGRPAPASATPTCGCSSWA